MKASKVDYNLFSKFVKFPFKVIFSRFTLMVLALVIQIAFIASCFVFFSRYLLWIFGGTAIFSLILTILIINRSTNPSFQISWIILILLFPTIGVYVYLFVKLQIGVHSFSKRYQHIKSETSLLFQQNPLVYNRILKEDKQVANYATYMNQTSGYPLYQNSKVTYYAFGEEMYPNLLKDLKSAKKYIFLEYFIVAKGVMWNSILEILKEKVHQGVEVYFMYDGTCSFALLPHDYPDMMRSYGIHCKVFNPVVPIISTHYNNRDHRKILVVDGKIAYTGGVNLADEYINQYERYGVWKDNAIRITGEAVRSFVLLFLENWNAIDRDTLPYENYLPHHTTIRNSSFVLPFGDNPLDAYPVGQVSYLQILQTATDYVHIITPYLLLDYELLQGICKASMSGIDVNIIMPFIADKKIINYMGKTYYKTLLEAGVHIYEYKPGFTHAKMMISDDVKAVIGTINLDFRSLYLNFENGVFLYQDESIQSMEEDYQKTLEDCVEITLEYLKKYPLWKMLLGKILRIFAPLL